MQVSTVTLNGYSETVKLHAVYAGDKNSEDNSYAKSTPSAMMEMQIDNPSAQGKLKPGMKVYIDFTVAEEPTA
jgi:hypothetical protein